MTVLHNRESISGVANILHAAMALGRSLWNEAPERNAGAPDPSQLATDLLALFRMLNEQQASYMLVGGIALLRYIEGRNTDDVDLIIATDSLARAPQIAIHDRAKDTARGSFGKLRVDLLLTSNPVFEHVQRSYSTIHEFSELRVPCATVEGLILLKLYALPSLYLQQHLDRAALYENDILMLLSRYQIDVGKLLGELTTHVSTSELAELHGIVTEIQSRIARMRGTGKS